MPTKPCLEPAAPGSGCMDDLAAAAAVVQRFVRGKACRMRDGAMRAVVSGVVADEAALIAARSSGGSSRANSRNPTPKSSPNQCRKSAARSASGAESGAPPRLVADAHS